ncbi:hypothetical protein [Spongiimicrobium sp. 2-473A-2-J]|uniref:hypothetical protein n=1 Tax=Eudoraea algarum TaxID=3417568 RepID=UPI003D36F50B
MKSKKNAHLFLILSLLLITGCNNEDDSNSTKINPVPLVFNGDFDSDKSKLDDLLNDIKTISSSVI